MVAGGAQHANDGRLRVEVSEGRASIACATRRPVVRQGCGLRVDAVAAGVGGVVPVHRGSGRSFQHEPTPRASGTCCLRPGVPGPLRGVGAGRGPSWHRMLQVPSSSDGALHVPASPPPLLAAPAPICCGGSESGAVPDHRRPPAASPYGGVREVPVVMRPAVVECPGPHEDIGIAGCTLPPVPARHL